MDQTRRSDFKNAFFDIYLTDITEESSTDTHDGRKSVTTESKMALIKQDGGVGTFLDLVGEGLVTRGSETNDLVVVDLEFVSTWRILSFRDRFDDTVKGDTGFQSKILGLVCIGKVAR